MLPLVTVFRDHPALLAAFRHGQRDALEYVYRSYVRTIDRDLRRLVHANGKTAMAHGSSVSDLVQETFARAFAPGARRGYDGLRPYGPYLGTIARHCFLDVIRIQAREVRRDPEVLPLELQHAEDPEDRGDPKVMSVLDAYIRQLPRHLESLYEQRFVLARSQEQASNALGISRRSLRTREERLRRGLRLALQGAGIQLRELKPSCPI